MIVIDIQRLRETGSYFEDEFSNKFNHLRFDKIEGERNKLVVQKETEEDLTTFILLGVLIDSDYVFDFENIRPNRNSFKYLIWDIVKNSYRQGIMFLSTESIDKT